MDFAERVKNAVDIVGVIGEYVKLQKAGPTRFKGLCPFHQEKTPSFYVNTQHQFYKCFGCNAGGDLFKFVMEMERISFSEALEQMAQRAGMAMPRRQSLADPEARLRDAVQAMHDIAVSLFQDHLHSAAGAGARAYLAGRGVEPALMEEFALGLSDRSGQALVRRFEHEGFSPEAMENSGLVLRRQDGSGWYDRFRGRLMFPIHNERGKVIGFGGRALAPGDEPKYLNSPETPIYRKGSVLYNLHRAKEAIRRNGRSLLVEGYMDVIGVYGAGIREVVASCGTALTVPQVQSLRRHSERIVVNFDPDPAGASATERCIELLLQESMQVRVLELEGRLDPDEFVRANGAGQYQARLDGAPNYFHWLARRVRARHSQDAAGRVAAFEELLPSINRVPDRLERVAVVNDVAEYLRVGSGLVLDLMRKAAAERRDKAWQQPPRPDVPAVERLLLSCLLSGGESRDRLIPLLRPLAAWRGFVTERLFSALFAAYDSGSEVCYASVEARLQETDRNLMASLILADDNHEAAFSEQERLAQALECLRVLEERERQSSVKDLKARIKDAERTGNLQEAMRLMQELSGLPGASGRIRQAKNAV